MAFVESLPPRMTASMQGDLARGNRLELPWLSGALAAASTELSLLFNRLFPVPSERFRNWGCSRQPILAQVSNITLDFHAIASDYHELVRTCHSGTRGIRSSSCTGR
jgi:hypothetical protein